jgi:enterochelin esterase family protein
MVVFVSLLGFSRRTFDTWRMSASSFLLFYTFLVISLTSYAAENPGKQGNGNHTVGPEYKIDPDLTDQGNPKGKSFEFKMRLADSKIFRGDDPTLEPDKKPVRMERKICVCASRL